MPCYVRAPIPPNKKGRAKLAPTFLTIAKSFCQYIRGQTQKRCRHRELRKSSSAHHNADNQGYKLHLRSKQVQVETSRSFQFLIANVRRREHGQSFGSHLKGATTQGSPWPQ